MGQKSTQLTHLEKVQRPKEKSRVKHFFAKVIKVVAKVYSREKSLGIVGHFKHTM